VSQSSSAIMIAALIVASVLAGTGLGLAASQEGGFGGIATTITQNDTSSGQNASAPYVLTLIITTDNRFQFYDRRPARILCAGAGGAGVIGEHNAASAPPDRAGNLELR